MWTPKITSKIFEATPDIKSSIAFKRRKDWNTAKLKNKSTESTESSKSDETDKLAESIESVGSVSAFAKSRF